MRKIPLTTFLLFAFLGASCTSAPPEPEVSPEAMKSEYETALESAKQAYKKVDDVGFAWRDTEEMIQKSEDTAKGGDYAGASKLAKRLNVRVQTPGNNIFAKKMQVLVFK